MNKKSKPSVIDKVPSGLAGFDRLTSGGLPAKGNTLLLGSPGTGKTTFALQMMAAWAERGESSIFVSLTEPPGQLREHAGLFGWDLAALEQRHLVFLDPQGRSRLVEPGPYDLPGLLADLRARAGEIRAKSIIFDSVDVLLTMLDSRPAELQALFRLRDWLFENAFTGLMTADLAETRPAAQQRAACLHFVADCALEFQVSGGDPVPSRQMRVFKYRGSTSGEKTVPFVIGASGVEVLDLHKAEPGVPGTPAAIQREVQLARRELNARLKEMDRFLEAKEAELQFLRAKPAARRQGQTAPRSVLR
jgi:circadian clock protein KaiC